MGKTQLIFIALLAVSCTSTLLCMDSSSEDVNEAPTTELSLEDKLHRLRTAAPEKVFIRGLPYDKRESQAAIVERLVSLPDAITFNEKKGTVTVEGPLVDAFVQNTQTALFAKSAPPSPPRSPKKESAQNVNVIKEIHYIPAPVVRTKYDMLKEAKPETITIMRGTEIVPYTLEEKKQLLAGLCSAIETVEETALFGEHTKETVINIAKLTSLPICKEQVKVHPTFTQQMFSHGALVTGFAFLSIGYLLAQQKGSS